MYGIIIMKRKWLAVGIILLFVGIAYAPAIAQDTRTSLSSSRGEWLYVGGSGPGNYTRIQDAIDNASDGDTIFVYEGTYYEYSIKISKQITLIGEKKDATIVDGQGIFSVVFHAGGGAHIQGFTVQNAGEGVGFFIGATPVIISNNIITKCAQGVYLNLATQSEIYNNVFFNNTDAGVCGIVKIGVHSIHDNYFLSNPFGILAEGGGKISIEYYQFERNYMGISSRGCHAKINSNNFIHNNRHVEVYSIWNIQSLLVLPLFYLPRWNNNYWDDWNTTAPRPIAGTLVLYGKEY
ncbi:hypothetical protein AYK25_00990 [Thermoplasmatales archaeon SM1-50]|nr:MAG: hypothetical protein AYK25_00990 [Thermoplasmatales archaeon SM1-50]